MPGRVCAGQRGGDLAATQVVPRRYARYPFGAGIALALVALVGVLFS